MACPYKYLFGVPGQGVHSTRIFGFALVDSVLTILIAILTALLFRASFTSFIFILLAWFVLGEFLHYILGTNTEFLRWIHLEPLC